MNVCAQRYDGEMALEIARDQRTSRCGPPTEKFIVRHYSPHSTPISFFLAFFVIRQYAEFCLCLQSSESESVRYLITPFPLILPLPPSHNFIHALSLTHSLTLILPLTHSHFPAHTLSFSHSHTLRVTY